MMDVNKASKYKNISRWIDEERTSPMSGEITSRTVHKDQEGDTQKRSKSLNEVKSLKNINKNKSFL